ncbi:MAG: HNH endonuclease [Thermoleophilaceae bacterium]
MTRPGESVEAITVPRGDPGALEGSATQLRAVGGQLNESAARLAAMPSLLSSWAGPGSSSFALLSGNQADTVRSQGAQVSMAALSVQNCADTLADSQRDARRAIERAEQARREIDRARAQIADAKGDRDAAERRMDAAMAARSVAEHAPLIGGTGLETAAVALAQDAYRAAEHDLHVAEARERRARGRLGEAEDDSAGRARTDRSPPRPPSRRARFLQMALGGLPAGALAMAGAPAAGQIAAQGGIERPQVRDVPIGEREPPKSWPGWEKAWFKLGRGERTAVSGLFNLGRSAVKHPGQVPGALYGVGKHAVDDPLGTGKQLVGYDELAKGRYADWLGQAGIAFLTGGAVARGARLRRLAGSPKPYGGAAFGGSRLDFSKPGLGARRGTSPTIPANLEQLARDYPRGVRFTRAGYPVLTPYAVKRVGVDGLNGEMGHDNPLANAKAGIGGSKPPKGYTWHHVEDGKTMELVPKDLHRGVEHTGGRAAVPDQLKEVTLGGAFSWGERGTGVFGGLGGGRSVKIDIRDDRPPVSTETLAAAEARLAELGHPIPPSYKAFLADQDGGEPVRDFFSFRQGERDQHALVQWFYGIAESLEGDLVGEAESLIDRVPAGVLSIAGDGSGNAVVMDGRDGRDGPVYFWDHEFEGEPPDESNLWWLAPDLETFLADLIEEPEPLPVVGPSGWRRLFGG